MRELAALRAGLDACAVGQEEAKRALLLGVIAREHVLLAGPPGCGKSRLARALAALCGARLAEPVLHRDVRGEDLLGDARLVREPHARGERLRLDRIPGELLRAELWLLDDLERAPAPSLAPVLRALGTRRGLGRDLPLECAIATLGIGEDGGAEPAGLDRFALQVRMSGLVQVGHLGEARELLDRGEPIEPRPLLDARARHALQRAAAALELGADVRRAWLALVAEALGGLEPGDAVRLTDRATLGAAAPLLRAHALLRGAARVGLADLEVVRWLVAPRLPAQRRGELDAFLERARSSAPATVRFAAAAGRSGAPGAGAGAATSGVSGGSAVRHSRPLGREISARSLDAGVRPLLRALEGEWSRGRAGRREDPAGAPRGQRRLRSLDEALDADPVEAWLFASGRWPDPPRTWRRERRGAGAVALLRDVSASMEGRLGAWAGHVISALVRSARRFGLRVGYVEFDHEAVCFREGDRFFHRRYGALLARASLARASGRTSYEAPLRAALDELRRTPAGERHVVLLTDGLPVAGDPEVRAERRLAQHLGVRVHTVFIGLGDCPEVLDRLSAETRGLDFRARPVRGGRIEVERRMTLRERERCTSA